MTSPTVPTLVCPNCGSADTKIGASGNAMCLSCASMWDPTNPAVPFELAPQPFAMKPVDEVYAPEPEHALSSRGIGHDDLIGGTATLEGGQTGEVVSFTTHDTLIVRLPSDDLLEVPISDVERIMEPVVIPDPVALPTDPDDVPADMLLVMELAKVIIRAGCEAVNGTGEHITPGVPPVGYLPSDEELHPVVERAAGLAVGMLLDVLEADVDDVLEWVGAVSQETSQGDLTTEGTDEQ